MKFTLTEIAGLTVEPLPPSHRCGLVRLSLEDGRRSVYVDLDRRDVEYLIETLQEVAA